MATKNIKEKYNVTGSVLVFRAGILNNLVGLSPTFFTNTLVAQSVEARVLETRCWGFESLLRYHSFL
jgi:hypothetical protein